MIVRDSLELLFKQLEKKILKRKKKKGGGPDDKGWQSIAYKTSFYTFIEKLSTFYLREINLYLTKQITNKKLKVWFDCKKLIKIYNDTFFFFNIKSKNIKVIFSY